MSLPFAVYSELVWWVLRLGVLLFGCGAESQEPPVSSQSTPPALAQKAQSPASRLNPGEPGSPTLTPELGENGSLFQPSVPPRIDQCQHPGGADAAEPAVVVRPALTYREVHQQPLALDLYRPRGRQSQALPVVVLVHGGGWRAGERGHVESEALVLAQQGFAVAAVDYRLVPAGTFPAAVSDVRCAVRYLAARSEELNLDRERMVPVGFSAGGHLVALSALAPEDERLDDVPCPHAPVRVAAWVAYFAPFDLHDTTTFPQGSRLLIQRFLGTDNAETAGLASATRYVTERAPAAVLVHGRADTVVPLSESEAMVAALEARDVPVRFVDLVGAGHGFRMFSQAPAHRPGLCTVMAFLRSLREGR